MDGMDMQRYQAGTRNHRSARVPLFAALLLLSSAAYADRITLANGTVIDGRVVSQDKTHISIESRGMVLKLGLASVKSVEAVESHENTLIASETAFKRSDPAKAIELLMTARRQGAAKEKCAELVDRYQGRISTAIQAANDQRQRAAIRLALHELLKSDFLTPNTLYYQSQNFYQLEDWTAAWDAMNRIPSEEVKRDPMMRVWALDFMRQLVRRQLARGDFEGAIAYVERMKQLTGDDNDPQFPITHLTRSAAARDAGNYRQAFEVIAQELQPKVPEIARNRVLYTLSAMMEAYHKSGDFSRGLESIEPIREVFPVEYRVARNKLVEGRAKKLLEDNQPQNALSVVESIPSLDRTAELQALYQRAFHESEMARIGDKDPLELLKHGRWCLEQGLLDESIIIFNKTRENPALKDVSDELLVNARRDRDTRLLEQAQSDYDIGNYAAALAKAQIILQNPNVGSTLTQEAAKLEELSKKEIATSEAQRPYMAEVLYQNAERDYYMGNLEGSFKQLQMVLDEFPDTPAAKRGAGLLPDVLKALELAYLEGRPVKLPTLGEKYPLEAVQKSDKLSEEVTRLLEALSKAEAQGI